MTDSHGHARELTKAAVARGARLVMAWGGDGTINEVASALTFGEVPLGIVPAGSGNGLARQLGISRNPADAIRHAISAEPRRIGVPVLYVNKPLICQPPRTPSMNGFTWFMK